MRSALLVAIAVACLGCEIFPYDGGNGSGTGEPSGAPGTGGGGECHDEDPVETRLPGYNYPPPNEVVVECRSCEHGCEIEGDPCEAHGSPCDYFGEPGICIACCNGTQGELHCSDIE